MKLVVKKTKIKKVKKRPVVESDDVLEAIIVKPVDPIEGLRPGMTVLIDWDRLK